MRRQLHHRGSSSRRTALSNGSSSSTSRSGCGCRARGLYPGSRPAPPPLPSDATGSNAQALCACASASCCSARRVPWQQQYQPPAVRGSVAACRMPLAIGTSLSCLPPHPAHAPPVNLLRCKRHRCIMACSCWAPRHSRSRNCNVGGAKGSCGKAEKSEVALPADVG